MLSMNEIRKGKVITLEGEPYTVLTAQFSRKQKSRPVVRSTLKHLQSGKTREHTFMQSDKVAEADLEQREWQYLYGSEGQYTFMDQATFEQVELGEDIVGEAAPDLLEGQAAHVGLFEGKPVSVELPIKITRKILEAPPGVRGDTSSNVMKEVVIEGGTTMKAPLFVKAGDTIVIDTRTGEYVERA